MERNVRLPMLTVPDGYCVLRWQAGSPHFRDEDNDCRTGVLIENECRLKNVMTNQELSTWQTSVGFGDYSRSAIELYSRETVLVGSALGST